MSKNVAVIGSSGKVFAINVHNDDYALQPYEVVVTDMAWVGGSYVNGVFYPPSVTQ